MALEASISLAEPPTCAVSVGVTGHRTDKLTPPQMEQLREPVRQVLTAVRDCVREVVSTTQGYAPREPVLRVISSLAEGADRMVAAEGLSLGFHLQCPLPANRREYRRDFSAPQSAAEYDDLLARADAVFELNGPRAGPWLEPSAYLAAGRIMLAHSELLIAIWDGEPGKEGGTAQIVDAAHRTGIPVIRIVPAGQPGGSPAIEFLSAAGLPLAGWREELQRTLKSALDPPEEIAGRLAQFVREPAAATSGKDPIGEQRDQADSIAQRYARRYRSTHKALYCLAPLAVLFAIAGWWLSDEGRGVVPEALLAGAEFLCILVILSITSVGRRGEWHKRWLDARVLAEQFRTWAFLAPIAHAPPTARVAPYVSPHARKGDWTPWFFRARVRQYGLTSGALTSQYLADYQRQLRQVVSGQAEHHRVRGEQREQTHKKVEFWIKAFFVGTGVVCLVHFFACWPLDTKNAVLLATLAAITSLMPAFAAALEGFQAQGEYQRLAERSEGMRHYFTGLAQHLPAPEEKALPYTTLEHLAQQAGDVMLDELSDWRNLVRVRVLNWYA